MSKSERTHSGYIYTKRTRQGFIRLQRMGIPKPPFRLEDGITRGIAAVYQKEIDEMAQMFTAYAKEAHIPLQDAPLDIQKAVQWTKAALRRIIADIIEKLKQIYHGKEALNEKIQQALKNRLEKQLYSNQQHFLTAFFSDASDTMKERLYSFSIDKNVFFLQNLTELRSLYLDTAMERINGETNALRKQFLQKLTDYAEGHTDTLDVQEITAQMKKTSVKVARFFARDQISRFNNALTLASFTHAGVKTVKWVTVGDQRVRDSHKRLNGKVFPITELPKEKDDYLCRCALIPVSYDE